ncbi:hypothetical protein DAPPUDRAFT_332519 [Daphnia pulex]|uniref:SWIM-type domain-containing protein n=1 Tax=Daphnia pulex TaxID=6669 RepID=E9HQ65_DAPPU|nr:hypothetical protein DAPPUDRAFT_332519 [Daphnia pulex]|eukprot:EFX66116.1 hypothetical protein DAPPUDRAFT_332519 [Daphnia pulex]
MILALEEISASFYSEILRGRYGRGNYHLHQDFTSLYDLEKDCPFLPEVRHEEEIFKSLKDAVGKATKMGADETPGIKLEEGSDFSLSCAIGTFSVTGSTATRDVRIFPYPSCSCPETKICYHVMARLASGLANTIVWELGAKKMTMV